MVMSKTKEVKTNEIKKKEKEEKSGGNIFQLSLDKQ